MTFEQAKAIRRQRLLDLMAAGIIPEEPVDDLLESKKEIDGLHFVVQLSNSCKPMPDMPNFYGSASPRKYRAALPNGFIADY